MTRIKGYFICSCLEGSISVGQDSQQQLEGLKPLHLRTIHMWSLTKWKEDSYWPFSNDDPANELLCTLACQTRIEKAWVQIPSQGQTRQNTGNSVYSIFQIIFKIADFPGFSAEISHNIYDMIMLTGEATMEHKNFCRPSSCSTTGPQFFLWGRI